MAEPVAAPKAQVFRFGPFELDIRAGELRKLGIRLRLREQSRQILHMLLEHPGEVVLRDEIRLRLWPNNTIVEFDHGINAAIQKLRDVLGEPADQPRYIETLARRGYRFLGEVDVAGRPTAAPAPPPESPVAEAESVDHEELTGKTIAHYRILDKLGEGGMGVVYRAEDLKLGRQVALKFLPRPAADLPEAALLRFEREGRAIASMNHPHICQIYEIGPDYLVMELVEGQPIKGPIAGVEAMRLAGQIADALDAAHRKGITHRDLKPANILLTRSGVKLLDFGLAKVRQAVQTDGAKVAEGLTGDGTILGTLHYMSPEQLQGQDADARSDIFSFGLVLYEMLTGRHAMEGASRASVIAAILERPAPSVAGLAPAALDRILKRCLTKDPDERWQTVRDIKFALDSIAGPSSEGNTARPVPRSRWLWLAAGVFVLAAAVFAAARFSLPTPTPVQRLKIVVETPRDGSLLLALSPDGSRFALGTPAGLRVRALDSLDSQLIPGTSPNASNATWSPDGRYLAYWTNSGVLKKVSVAGDTPQTLVGGLPNFRGMAWNNDGTILYSTGTPPLLRVSENGGTPTAVAAGKNGIQPTPLPDGRHFLYLAPSGDKAAIYAASLDSTEVHQVTEANSQAEFVPPNRLLFLRGTTLMAQPFDLAQLRTTGQAIPVAEDIGIFTITSHASFTTARNGMIAYQTGGVGRTTLTWVDRAGKPTNVVDEEHLYLDIALSPDGKLIATARVDPKTLSLGVWVTDVGRGIATRITSEGESADQPAWSPDGKRIAYVANGIRTKSADGTGTEELQGQGSMPQWSPDSRTLVFADGRRKGLSLVSTAGDHRQVRYRDGSSAQPAFSPDGRWMAYASQQAEGWEVFVESVPAGHGKWQISKHGGAQPVWRQDGSELFYRSADNKIMVAPVRTGSSFEAGASKELFLLETLGGNSFRRMYAVSSDGQRFLIHRRSEYHQPMILLQNWLRPGK